MKREVFWLSLLLCGAADAQPIPVFASIGGSLGQTQAQFEQEHGKALDCQVQDGRSFCVYDKARDMLRVNYLEGRVVSVFWHVPKAVQRPLTAADILPPNRCSMPPAVHRQGELEWLCADGSVLLRLSNDRQGVTWAVDVSYPTALAEIGRLNGAKAPRQ